MNTSRQQPAPGATPEGAALSPYLVGAAIGLLNIGAFAAFKKGIGVSGAYESSAALAARSLAPDAVHVNDYVRARKAPPKFNWESWLVLGAILGGMAAARTGRGSDAATDDPEPVRATRSPLASAVGGAMLMYGARMADGCTSGHSLSGTAQGAASSWLFTPLMFGVASLLARRSRGASRPDREA
jgi:uncharacterized membrane protein YedE/YeeE